MRVLVLGGTHFVGRALVEELLTAGEDVTTLTSGHSGGPPAGVEARYADRRDPAALASALEDDTWDAVVDTWAGEPRVVQTAVRLLSGRVRHWTYVSSRSVYEMPLAIGADESAPVVPGDPGSDDDFYPTAKRGGELASLELDGEVLIARAGLVVGPWENVGRLPFWLERIARGGRVPAPGPPGRALQLLDARDLAVWVRRCALEGTTGTYNVTTPSGAVSMGDVLDACLAATGSDADLVWLDPEVIETAGVQPWTELPLWLPPGHEASGMHDCDVSRAMEAGFVARGVPETVADTWAWIQREGMPAGTERGGQGMDADAEARLWAAQELGSGG